jgi:hypothetical protein
MKTRLVLATVVAGALAASLSGAEAATPVLDGKKVKTLTASYTPEAQTNDAALLTGVLDGTERVDCVAPRCSRLTFTYQPAKGVKGNLSFKTTWSLPVEDMDLYVAEIDKKGFATEIAHCGSSVGVQEQIILPSSAFKAGKTYALITDFYRASGQKVTSTVSFPGSGTIKQTVPANVDELLLVNCGQ